MHKDATTRTQRAKLESLSGMPNHPRRTTPGVVRPPADWTRCQPQCACRVAGLRATLQKIGKER
jgi:hypothetical protein